MIRCLSIPENITPYSFIYNLALEYDKKDYNISIEVTLFSN